MSADLGSARGSIEIEVGKAMANIGQLQSTLTTFGKTSTSALAGARGAGLVMAGAGAAILGVFGLATKEAAGFEQEMSAVQAVTNATGKDFDALRQLALDLGKDTVFGASEAAQAIEELGKAGVSIDDIMSGAAKGATDLAAAAGVALPEAALVMANALNIFGLSGDQATHVADVLTAGANKSATSVDLIAQALEQAGTVAAAFNIPLEDTVGLLALLADNGLKGSDAGTSVKTMLQSLLDPTQKQADLMNQLGISFFDAQGNFIGLAGVADVLKTSLSGLTEEQRNTALAVLFGSDAVRAATILYGAGKDGVNEYTKAVDDNGAAHDAAAKRLDNFNGSMEQLKGSIQTLAITIGSIFLPAIRQVVDAATGLVNAFLGLPKPVQDVVAAVGLLTGGVLALVGGFVLLAPQVSEAVKAFKALAPLLAGIAPEVAAIVGVLAALGIAYKTNFLGFADAVNGVGKGIGKKFSDIAAGAKPLAKTIGDLFTTPFEKHGGDRFTTQLTSISEGITGVSKAFGLTHDEQLKVATSLVEMAKPARQLRNSFRDVTKGASEFFDILGGDASKKERADFQKRMKRLFGKDIGKDAIMATRDLRKSMKGLNASFKSAFGVDLSKMLSLPAIMGLASKAVSGLASFVKTDLLPALGPLFVGVLKGATAALTFLSDHMDTIAHVVKTVGGLIGSTLAAPFRILAALLRGDVAGALGVVTGLLGDFMAAGADLLGWVLNVGAPQAIAWTKDLWVWLRDKGLPGFFDIVGKIAGWILNVGEPQVEAWAADAFAWVMALLFGGTAVGDGTDMDAQTHGLVGWILDVGVPQVAQWAEDAFGWAMEQIFGGKPVGDGTDMSAHTHGLVGWILDVGVPTVIGWLKEAAEDTWTALKTAANWTWDGIAKLGDWTLLTAIPTVKGWIKSAAITAWPFLKAAANWTWDTVAQLGAWTLHTVVPTITGWVDDTQNVINDIATKLGHPTVTLGSWTLVIPTPSIAFEGGFDLGRTIHDHLPIAVVKKEWKLVLAAPLIVPFAGLALAALILEKIGVVRLFNFTKWVLEVGFAGTVGFVAGLIGPRGSGWVADKISAAMGAVEAKLPSWTLTVPDPDISFGGTLGAIGSFLGGVVDVGAWILGKIGQVVPDVSLPSWTITVPDPTDVLGIDFDKVFNWIFDKVFAIGHIDVPFDDWSINIGEPKEVKLAKTVWEIVKDNLVPLSATGGVGSGTESDPLRINASVTVDASQAKADAADIKKNLDAIDNKTFKATVSLEGATAIQAVSDAFAAFADGTSAAGTAGGFGSDVAADFAAGMDFGSDAVTTAATDLTGDVFAPFQGFLQTATDIGTEVGGNYADGIGSKAAVVAGAAGGLVSSATGALGGGYAAAYSAGALIGTGLANGIASMTFAVQSAATALAKAAADAVASAAKISSPSKVFADLGKQMGAGLEAGLKQSTQSIKRAGERLANQALPATRAASMGTGAGAGGGSSFVDARQFFALHSDDFVRLVGQAERGGSAFTWIAKREGAFSSVGA